VPSQHPLHRRVGAWIALGALLAAIGLPVLGFAHVPDRDVDSLAIGAALHHPTTQFERVIDPPGDEHCLVCHLHRVLSGADANAARHHAPPTLQSNHARTEAAAVVRREGLGLPPRAPPSPDTAVFGLRPSLAS
jgi:hypothetical protein